MAESYLEILSQKITSLNLAIPAGLQLECKHFFNGAALYANGKMCASLTPAGFGIKLPANVRQWLIEAGNAKALRYFDKAPVKREYVALPPSILDDPEEMRSLVKLSISYVINRQGASSHFNDKP